MRRKSNKKNDRIDEEVFRELSNIIHDELKDPRIGEVTSVTRVHVSPDLKTAKAYISVYGDEEALERTMEGLKSSAGFIRRQLAHRLNLRNTPEITYIADDSIAYGIRMSKMIDEVTSHLPEGEENHDTIE